MKLASASQLLAIATALCAVVLFGACKTTESARWRKQEIGTEWEKRTLGKVTQAQNQMKAAHDGDNSEGFMSYELDAAGNTPDSKVSRFGRKEARTKNYRTKNFAGGADEYKSDDYQFLKRQNFQAKTSSDQGDVFATGEAPDNKRRFFGRNKRARTKDFAGSNSRFQTGSYSGTSGRKAGNPAIVEDQAGEDRASLSVDDVRNILHGPSN